MTDTVDVTGPETVEEPAPVAPVKAPPIESRFLYVDVAAMRAKQRSNPGGVITMSTRAPFASRERR